ncbi:hypothetical protein [Myxococcus sp. CA039A]|uniref:hypothetical protein n=1 Tax=Myxococcus sp. CA039A TaxID=2741737 RepID=UPI00157A6F4C|nr:hypothetical protein [Myxococcus sp. CA039A]NTX58053.1 hypothetical protein [Myxococcus sp. CA039A]
MKTTVEDALRAELRHVLAEQTANPESSLASANVGASPLQWLEPALRWDWVPTVDGTMGDVAHHFYDGVPASIEDGAPFVSTSASFSGRYLTFLRVLSPSFEPVEELKESLERATPPSTPPASSSNPPGWTKVQNKASLLQWGADYTPAKSPYEWLAGMAARGLTTGPVRVDVQASTREGRMDAQPSLLKVRAKQGTLKPLELKDGELLSLTVSMEGLGRVPLYTGHWFNGSMPILGRKGPFKGGYTPEQVFGAKGLLSGRVAEMMVAYQPSFELTVASSFFERHAEDLASAEEVQVAGFSFRGTREAPGPVRVSPGFSGGSVGLSGASASFEPPFIVAVLLETFD